MGGFRAFRPFPRASPVRRRPAAPARAPICVDAARRSVSEGGAIMAAAATAGFGETVSLFVPRMLAVSLDVPHPKLASFGGVRELPFVLGRFDELLVLLRFVHADSALDSASPKIT